EEAIQLRKDISNCIESLKAKQFSLSSRKYVALVTQMSKMQKICETLLVLMLISNILATAFLTKKLMKPLKDLTDAAYSAAEGNLELEELPVVNMDEVGIVTDAFNRMLKSIRSYISQIHENMERETALKENEFRMQGLLKDAQLKYMQAQIKPHFLFNTLNAGVQLAMMENAEKTQKLLENTAAFYRYNVSKNNQSSTIREELELVDAYIYISEVRFGDSFVFEKDVEEHLLDRKIPSMILQPLVENSFKYGIKDLEVQGRIELTVQALEEGINISVWDNGCGISAHRIRQILEGSLPKSGENRESSGMGLYNVKERLMLFFDNQAVFRIESEGEGMGTEISITIPNEEEV
ncbi:MAG: histidine kinase, partial [Lachnospiraceae bacterium]|nr:histidine kinase [Lachnospiraceae bacterium]